MPRVLVTCGEIVVAGAIDNSYTCCQGDLSAKGCQVAEVHNSFNLICSVVDTGTIHSDFVVFYNYFIEKNNNTCYCSIYAYFNQCFIDKSALPCIQMCRSVERRKRLIFISVSQCDFYVCQHVYGITKYLAVLKLWHCRLHVTKGQCLCM